MNQPEIFEIDSIEPTISQIPKWGYSPNELVKILDGNGLLSSSETTSTKEEPGQLLRNLENEVLSKYGRVPDSRGSIYSSRSYEASRYGVLKGSIIVIEGIIGVGKTTLGRSIQAYLLLNGLDCAFFPEYRNDKLLAQYIGDMKKYAYGFQTIMLSKRIAIYNSALEAARSGKICIVDRSLAGDFAFATMQLNNGNITKDEFDVYCSMIKMENSVEPSLVVYLECDVVRALERTKKRSCTGEDKYDIEYFQALSKAYHESIKSLNCPVLKLDWNRNSSTSPIESSKRSNYVQVNGLLPETVLNEVLEIIRHEIVGI